MSSNQQILSIVGQALGSYFGPVGAAIGGGIGSYLGASLDTLPDAFGPRLEDRKLLTSSFGTAIPFAYGSNRISGNIIWLLGAVDHDLHLHSDLCAAVEPDAIALRASHLGRSDAAL
jgi:hypothetical protein